MSVAVIEALGVYAPERVVHNDDLAQSLDTSDAWIRTRTGIVERHYAAPGQASGDLAIEAAQRALKTAAAADVDAVVVSTTTPDRPVPATAPRVAARLGLAGVTAFDVNGACSGFVYGLATSAGLLATGVATRVLLIGAEVLTAITDFSDRNTAVLFGDGAGAVVLRAGDADELGAVGPFDLGADGDLLELLHVPAGGSARPASEETLGAHAHYIHMDGREIYRQATHHMVASCQRVLERAGLDVTAVDRLVGHQANARILEAVANRLGVPEERCVVNIQRYGNTSSASLPLALAEADISPGEQVLLTSFGAGLTWASALVRWGGRTEQ